MNILAINTSFNESFVAVKTSNAEILKQMDSSLKQSENILGLIDESLNEANINLGEVNTITCVIGPGSFTGIRIGASICMGFCSSHPKIKRVAINSLDLLAYTFSKTSPSGDFWVVLNALSGNLFACKYNSLGEKIGEYMLLFGDMLSQINGMVVGLDDEHLEICTNYVSLSSKDLLDYAIILNDKITESTNFIPVYLRKSQAEAELDKKEQENKD